MIAKTSKHRDLKFKSEKKEREWLNSIAHMAIYFAGDQDLQKIIVDREGEIVYANLQQSVWLGKFIDLDRVKTDAPIYMLIDGAWKEMDFIIEEIIS